MDDRRRRAATRIQFGAPDSDVLAGHGAHDRWLMTTALAGISVCHLVVTAAGLRVLTARARLCLAVAGLDGLGIALNPQTAHGSAANHVAFTVLGAVAITAWTALVGRRTYRHGRVLSVRSSAIAATALTALLGWFIAEAASGGSQLGTAERVATAIQTCWPLAVALAAYRQHSR